jgi:hypothetical protein
LRSNRRRTFSRSGHRRHGALNGLEQHLHLHQPLSQMQPSAHCTKLNACMPALPLSDALRYIV